MFFDLYVTGKCAIQLRFSVNFLNYNNYLNFDYLLFFDLFLYTPIGKYYSKCAIFEAYETRHSSKKGIMGKFTVLENVIA